jgi:hypothetical protein
MLAAEAVAWTVNRSGLTSSTATPWACSQPVTASTEALLGEKRFSHCAGVR